MSSETSSSDTSGLFARKGEATASGSRLSRPSHAASLRSIQFHRQAPAAPGEAPQTPLKPAPAETAPAADLPVADVPATTATELPPPDATGRNEIPATPEMPIPVGPDTPRRARPSPRILGMAAAGLMAVTIAGLVMLPRPPAAPPAAPSAPHELLPPAPASRAPAPVAAENQPTGLPLQTAAAVPAADPRAEHAMTGAAAPQPVASAVIVPPPLPRTKPDRTASAGTAPVADRQENRPAPASRPQGGAPYMLQLASVGSPAAAEREWAKMQRDFPNILGKTRHRIEAADLADRGRVYRLRAGAFADRRAAEQACAAIAGKGRSCLVVRP